MNVARIVPRVNYTSNCSPKTWLHYHPLNLLFINSVPRIAFESDPDTLPKIKEQSSSCDTWSYKDCSRFHTITLALVHKGSCCF